MTQHEADRETIAEALFNLWGKYDTAPIVAIDFKHGDGWLAASGYRLRLQPTLDAAVAAFEALCGPKGWQWMRDGDGDWGGFQPKGMRLSVCVSSTGNHAADVCRLVCRVLEEEAKDGASST